MLRDAIAGSAAAGASGQISATYAILSVVALLLSTAIASRWFGRETRGESGSSLAIVWIGALAGAFLGAKAAFLLAEGLAARTDWPALIGGRSVAGALLGGYATVELAKRWVGWTRPTGDLFALTVPLSLAIGRIGCVMAGCCQGIVCEESFARFGVVAHDALGQARWPAAQVELLFNAAFFLWAIAASRFGWQRTQRFHVYLVAYGLFRFAHEFLRDDPRWFGPISGYHAVALGLVALGAWRYRVRARLTAS